MPIYFFIRCNINPPPNEGISKANLWYASLKYGSNFHANPGKISDALYKVLYRGFSGSVIS